MNERSVCSVGIVEFDLIEGSLILNTMVLDWTG
jgi:hypothetical protein